MIKIALPVRHAYPYHGHGGAQRYVYSLASALASQGTQVTLILPSTPGTFNRVYRELTYTFIPPDGRMNLVHFYTSYQPWIRHVARYIRDQAFDIVHTFVSGVSFYHGLQGNIPVIVQGFGNELFKVGGLRRWVRFLLYYPYIRRQFQVADAVASQGPFQDEELLSLYGISRDKIFRLPTGIDLQYVATCLAAQTRVTREYIGVQPDDLLVLNVGRLVPYKGVDYLLEAINHLRSEVPNLKLLLIGTGPDESRISRLIEALGLQQTVVHLRNVTDAALFQYYALADLFVMPSSVEGFPTVTLEAMACGLPVIGTNNNENIQVIREGKNGLLIPPRDSQAIANAIRRLQDRDLRRRMGDEARSVVQHYEWQAIARMALNKYEELLRSKR